MIDKLFLSWHFSGERVLRSRQHERGTSQERRYKRSHRRSPSSGRQHGHRDRDRDRAHLAHLTSSRRTRLHRHHGSSSPSQERHRHRSPSTRSQVSPRDITTHVLASIIPRFCSLFVLLHRVTHDRWSANSRSDHAFNPRSTETLHSRRLSCSVVFIDDIVEGNIELVRGKLFFQTFFSSYFEKRIKIVYDNIFKLYFLTYLGSRTFFFFS